VISKTHGDFWVCHSALPSAIQKSASEKFKLWKEQPFNSSLHFKQLIGEVGSVRINQNYRALARRNGNLIVWFWIGTHAEYDQLLKQMR
jgi:hypothetical protein